MGEMERNITIRISRTIKSAHLHLPHLHFIEKYHLTVSNIATAERAYSRQIKLLSLIHDLSPLSLLMLTNRAIFLTARATLPPKVSQPPLVYSCGGKVTRYFTLFFELDSFPLAIITTSFGPCLETDGDGKEGGGRGKREEG